MTRQSIGREAEIRRAGRLETGDCGWVGWMCDRRLVLRGRGGCWGRRHVNRLLLRIRVGMPREEWWETGYSDPERMWRESDV